MSFQPYPTYQAFDSGWISEVPQHWRTKRLKFLFRLQKREVRDADEIVTCFRDGQVTLRKNRRTDGFTNALQEIGYQGVRQRDLVIHAMDAFAGAIGVSDSDGKCSPVYSICSGDFSEVMPEYYGKLLRHMALSGYVSSLAKGIRERSTDFRWSEASELSVPLPSRDEQAQIVRFLDHEIAKIDALIAEQQRLIELLKEKRQAVISHAVTKGLDPNVPMKDSGVEWLGEVPAHWVIAPLKYLVSAPIIDGPHISPVRQEEGVPFISAEAISQGHINFDKKWGYISRKDHNLFSKRYCPKKGDILMVKLGATTGSVAIVETDEEFNVWVPLATIRVPDAAFSRFLLYFFQSINSQNAIQFSWTYGTQQTLGLRTLENFRVPTPTPRDLEEIVAFIETHVSRLDALVHKCEETAKLLVERRSALISAAVTGKIDVRNWQPPANGSAFDEELLQAGS